jgi:hypothetical protein
LCGNIQLDALYYKTDGTVTNIREVINSYKILDGKSEGNVPLGRPGAR